MRRLRYLYSFILPSLAACLLVTGLLSASPASAAAPPFGHVFVIVGENKSLSQINSSNAPYIMNTLKPASAWFTNYNDVAVGSLADYVALTSGQYAPCQVHGPCGSFNVPSIFSQVGSGAWQDWNESMPANCYPKAAGSDSALNAYKQGHNPALYYSGLPCSTYDIPAGSTGPDDMSSFNNALAAGTVPEYNFIAPNLCEAGYNSCNGANTVREFDNFLQQEIPLIKASPAFGSDGVIFVTFDEGHPQGNSNTMMALTGPQVQAGTYSGYYDHYSTMATVEQGLGLSCLANACTASTFPAFRSVSSPAVSITQPANNNTVSGSVTVAGTAAAQGSASIGQVQVSVDNGAPQTAAGTTDWSANIDTTGLSNGTHTITATATDSNNLTATASITITVSNIDTTSCPAVAPGATENSGNVSVESTQKGWTGKYNANSVVTRVQPPGGSYDGGWALQAGLASGATGPAGLSNASPLWVTSITGGTTYNGSVFVKANTAGEKISLKILEKNSAGATVGSHGSTLTLGDTAWRQITTSYTATTTGDSLRYQVYASNLADSSQNFLADCVSLQTP